MPGQPAQFHPVHRRLEVTDDAGAGYAAYAEKVETDAAVLTEAPFVLIGTQGEIVAKLRKIESRWGITRFAVRATVIDAIPGILAAY